MWQHGKSRHERGYGSAWVKLRATILARDRHLCQPCLAIDRVTPATQVDHITPKANGGTDSTDNLQAICQPCHDAKSRTEAAEAQAALRDEGKAYTGADGWTIEPKRWGYSIPHGLRPSGRRVVVVFGPPASGKSTYVEKHAAPSDKVIDLDLIKEKIGGDKRSNDMGVIRRALAWRDMAIRSLADETGTAWLIVTARTKAERDKWIEALGPKAEAVTLDTPTDECIRRIYADPTRKDDADQMVKVVREWERD